MNDKRVRCRMLKVRPPFRAVRRPCSFVALVLSHKIIEVIRAPSVSGVRYPAVFNPTDNYFPACLFRQNCASLSRAVPQVSLYLVLGVSTCYRRLSCRPPFSFRRVFESRFVACVATTDDGIDQLLVFAGHFFV